MSIRQAKIHGEVIMAKPVLLLALIDSIDDGEFTSNRFTLSEWLEKRYLTLMKQYTKNSQFDKPADISNPFWHLQSDGFWHLQYVEDPQEGVTPTKRWLKENVTFAYLDDDLWVLLQNKVWRQKLRDYIIEHKLTDDRWLGQIAAEGLGAIAALLLAA
jgi:putative restriction endonuclease